MQALREITTRVYAPPQASDDSRISLSMLERQQAEIECRIFNLEEERRQSESDGAG
ncbi:MAG TPA: hypothetical protein VF717_09425 [Pyrinomonadaceae bacterium]|jgi:hypothetical protein